MEHRTALTATSRERSAITSNGYAMLALGLGIIVGAIVALVAARMIAVGIAGLIVGPLLLAGSPPQDMLVIRAPIWPA